MLTLFTYTEFSLACNVKYCNLVHSDCFFRAAKKCSFIEFRITKNLMNIVIVMFLGIKKHIQSNGLLCCSYKIIPKYQIDV